MTTTKIQRLGYHGTSNQAGKSIEKSKNYIFSDSEIEWLGKGAYFFIDKSEDKRMEHAIDWSTKIRKNKEYAILKTEVILDNDEFIDFDDEEAQELFHEVKLMFLKKAENSNLYLKNGKKLDCKVMNEICESGNIKVATIKTYINFTKCDLKTPNSIVPNCKIMCVKDNAVIDKSTIEVIWEGVYNE